MNSGASVYRVLSKKDNGRSVTGLAAVPMGKRSGESIVHFKQHSTPEALQREEDEIIRATVATSRVDGIRPIQIAAHKVPGLLVTELVENAVSLFNYLYNGTRLFLPAKRQLRIVPPAECGRRLGEWLRQYHSSSSFCDDVQASDLLAKTIKGCTARFSYILKHCQGHFSAQTSDLLQTRLDRIGSPLSPTIQLSTIHGDFNHSNVLMTDHGLMYVLDFADTRIGFGLEDFIQLWHSIWTLSRTSERRSRGIYPFLKQMIDSYELCKFRDSEDLIEILRLRSAMIFIMSWLKLGWKQGLNQYLLNRQLAMVSIKYINDVCHSGVKQFDPLSSRASA